MNQPKKGEAQAAENRIQDGILYVEKRFVEERKLIDEERSATLIHSLETATNGKALYLDKNKNRALIISNNIVAKMPYHQSGGDITWEQCTLRQWLDTTYYESLPPDIKDRILEVTAENLDNPAYRTFGGNDTRDRVFLLSLDEAIGHFKDDGARQAKFQREAAWWWLRSPGSRSSDAACVGDGGHVYVHGSIAIAGHGGVRPAFWLNLDSAILEPSESK